MADQPEKKNATLAIKARGKAVTSGRVKVRLIQQSPAVNPKLLKEARKVARELKENRVATAGKGKGASSYAKKGKRDASLSLFPVK